MGRAKRWRYWIDVVRVGLDDGLRAKNLIG